MRTFTLFSLLLSLATFTSQAQELHTPAEILKIMENSVVAYNIASLEEVIEPEDRSTNLNFNFVYRKGSKGNFSTHEYEISEETAGYSDQAESFFTKGEYKKAREMYLKALDSDPTYYKVMTYVGQTYGIEKDWKNAIKWYQKTIKANPIDYMAHWFLADCYVQTDEPEKALDEITTAIILNRNNPRIKLSFDAIYKLNKLKTSDWVFTPQMQLDSIGPKEVKITAHEDWIGYAMIKAAWAFEPGYAASMGSKKGEFSILEEKEALLGLFVNTEDKKAKKDPAVKALHTAIEAKMLDEYIFFEIVLPQYPFVAYQLPDGLIDAIKTYVLKVRGGQK